MAKFCTQCGTKHDDETARFCRKCGWEFGSRVIVPSGERELVSLADPRGTTEFKTGQLLTRFKQRLIENRKELRGRELLWNALRRGWSDHQVHVEVRDLLYELEELERQTVQHHHAVETQHHIERVKSRLGLQLAEEELEQTLGMLVRIMRKLDETVKTLTDDEEMQKEWASFVFQEIVLARLTGSLARSQSLELEPEMEQYAVREILRQTVHDMLKGG